MKKIDTRETTTEQTLRARSLSLAMMGVGLTLLAALADLALGAGWFARAAWASAPTAGQAAGRTTGTGNQPLTPYDLMAGSVQPQPGLASTTFTAWPIVSANDVWAVGTTALTRTRYLLAEHWNGRAWGTVPSPNPASSTDNNLAGVAAIFIQRRLGCGLLVQRLRHPNTGRALEWLGVVDGGKPQPRPQRQLSLRCCSSVRPTTCGPWATTSTLATLAEA